MFAALSLKSFRFVCSWADGSSALTEFLPPSFVLSTNTQVEHGSLALVGVFRINTTLIFLLFQLLQKRSEVIQN